MLVSYRKRVDLRMEVEIGGEKTRWEPKAKAKEAVALADDSIMFLFREAIAATPMRH
jgi:hypothetical protein